MSYKAWDIVRYTLQPKKSTGFTSKSSIKHALTNAKMWLRNTSQMVATIKEMLDPKLVQFSGTKGMTKTGLSEGNKDKRALHTVETKLLETATWA
jgi:uncharacterized protein (DUF362 family)